MYMYYFFYMMSLFINKRFILNLMPQQNTSKFAIFYEYENPKLLFPFFILGNFMNVLLYVIIDQGIH